MLTQDKVIYSDFLINFERHPINKDLVRNVNESAVRQALKNIVMTNRGEIPYQPTRGSNVRRFLFEQMTPQTSHDIKEDVIQAIMNEERRIDLIGVTVEPNYNEQHYTIVIVFSILNQVTPQSVTITLERIN